MQNLYILKTNDALLKLWIYELTHVVTSYICENGFILKTQNYGQGCRH